ncbi:2OG-Fe(II) oxygenase [Tropicibacter sp. R16_0]|uniref:HalD/BesD family halogenase n=1 Tax=Tropicibacter sp. R16_0 TaxID=2821102 RepID=UPI001ADAF678|nr:2OG-Fe(II) oxygenase [Tropicibacter sp. R16_0]MBO9450082.1 2OG-Fe(II) oxygenase [Tropicibacter sp. R16_0]
MRDILDLDHFPLDRPNTPEWQALVDRCKADLDAEGMFNLDGLMLPEVAAQAVDAMSAPFATDAFLHERMHNIYFKPVEGLPDDHPALRQFQTSNRTLCADQIKGSPLLRLYEWPEFATFLAATMEMPELHVMEDPLARVNVMSYQEGQALNWHFDRSEFTTTLLLQAPVQGGGFEYRTDLRSEGDPNYDGVARLLNGEDPDAKVITLSPGTLNVFKGKNTAHRVTPVSGDKERVISVFSFYEKPGVQFSDAERIGFYGRAS